MPIEFACSSCHLQYSVKDELAGRTAKCGKCGHRMRIPQSNAVQATTVAATAAVSKSTVVRSPPKKLTKPPVDDDASWLNDELENSQPVIANAERAKPCPSCGGQLAAGAVLCVSCGYDTRTGANRETAHEVEGEEVQKSKARKLAGAAGSLMRGTLFSFIGAMLGAVLWAVLCYFTEWRFGIVAWALGGMAGYGMALGHEDNDGTFAGIVAACMSLVGIVAAKVLIIALFIGAALGAAVNEIDIEENVNPLELLREDVATELAYQKLTEKGVDPDEASIEQWEEADSQAAAEVKDLDEAALNAKLAEIEKAQEAVAAAEAQAAAEQLAANPPPAPPAEVDGGPGVGFLALFLLFMFHPLEILFVLAAVGTAYKVGSGQMTD